VREAKTGAKPIDWRSTFPWFVVWFLIAAALDSAGLIPVSWQPTLQAVALFAIVVALAGVGLSSDVARIRAAGFRPLFLGAILWATIALSSLALAHVPGVSAAP
jgi:uncharacterized membrane protein YadS